MLIYLLEDDDSIRKLVIYALDSQDYPARGFETPSSFWAAMGEELPDLVLLDIMLPEQDGISILRQLRSAPETARLPVIMLTAKNTEYDRVEGLDTGADDYISKPFGMMELISRIRAVLRRTDSARAPEEYELGALKVRPGRHETEVAGNPVSLTHKEFSLLCLLLENAGLVMSREILLERIWGLGSEPENRTLDVHIRTLRAKLGEAGEFIETIRGIGYRINGEK